MGSHRATLTALVAATVLLGAGCRQVPAPGFATAPTSTVMQAKARKLLISEGNRVELLVDGPAIFKSIHAAIDGAQSSIQVHAYQLGGETGMRIVHQLAEKMRAGVKVQVLLDEHHGGAGSGKDMVEACMAAMKEAGIPFYDYDMRDMPTGPHWVSKIGAIDHSKLIVIDGRVAYVGGMNFYDYGAENHDYMVKITGPAAQQVGEMTNDDYMHSAKAERLMMPIPAKAGETHVEIAQNSPRGSNIRSLITRYLDQAQRTIRVEMLMLDDDMVLESLVAAKERGVDVRVILDPMDWGAHVPELKDVPFDGAPNWAAVQDLLDADIPVSWYGRRNPHENLHAKACTVDGRYFLVGSANYTYRAFDINRETYAAMDAPDVAQAFDRIFATDEARSKRIETLSAWQRRLASLFELIKRGMFEPQEKLS